MGFMGASGRKCYTLRRNAPDGDFVREIKRTFDEAASNVPAVILLDDMDKFVTEEKNSEEYVAVQACIDEVRDKDVFVIATANNLKGIPDSLLRAGRFDRHILMRFPEGKDAEDIIPTLSDQEQYSYGFIAGEILKQIHTIQAPADQEDWEIYQYICDNNMSFLFLPSVDGNPCSLLLIPVSLYPLEVSHS
jgi:SpoVK/Ycf46/Vps4 family AAA+-type ATPase